MTRNGLLRIGVPLILAIAAFALYVAYALSRPLTMASHCETRFGTIAIATQGTDAKDFHECQVVAAKRFVEGHYAESKDLAKAFFTLTTAILVLSLTFFDKVIDISNASEAAFRATLSCWLLLLASILLTGGALSISARAATIALEAPWSSYREMTVYSTVLLSLATLLFSVGLASLLFGCITSLIEKRSRARQSSAG